MIQAPPTEILERMIAIIKSSYNERGGLIPCQARNAEDKKFFLRNYLIYYSGEPASAIERLYRSCENCNTRQNTYLTKLKTLLNL